MFGNMYTKLLKVFSREGHKIFNFLLNICLYNSKFLKMLNTTRQKKMVEERICTELKSHYRASKTTLKRKNILSVHTPK